jgi:uncharacterized protein (DUF2336 family)
MNEIKPRIFTGAPFGAPAGKKGDRVYQKARTIASDGSKKARRKLAGRKDAPPEVLYFLAEDPEPEVRRAIAGNASTPTKADLLLARDADDDVRCGLAGKIALLVPGLTETARERLRDLTLEVVEILARDELPRIRAILAEALAEVTGAPPPEITRIVRRLASDVVLEVAAPVLERSELLSDADLLEIIHGGPADGALSAIARRGTVGEAVAEVIAHGDDREAIAELLANPSAQIREETLDSIIDRAPDIESWHAALAHRPKLSPSAARRVAGFVAEALLQALCAREDLDPATARAVEQAMRRRLDDCAPDKAADRAVTREPSEDEAAEVGERPIDRAHRLHEAGELDEAALAAAVSSGDRRFVNAALAILAEVPVDVVREIVSSESAKAVTALAWKAGLGMRFAVELQMRHAGILPKSVIYARDGFDYPLSEEDLRWQIEFFGG